MDHVPSIVVGFNWNMCVCVRGGYGVNGKNEIACSQYF